MHGIQKVKDVEESTPIYLIALIIVWAAGIFGTAFVAKARGRDPGLWFLISLLCSPLLAMLFLLGLPMRYDPETDDRVRCVRCAERIHRKARICPFCRSEVETAV